MQPHLQAVLQDNPEITNPDKIRLGQLVVLRQSLLDSFGKSVNGADCNYVKSLWESMSPSAQDVMVKTSNQYAMLSAGTAATGTILFTLEKTLSSNLSLLKGIPSKYE